MFLTDCPTCGRRELRGPRAIELLVNRGLPGGGVDVVFRCTHCETVVVVGTSGPARTARSLVAA
jgi:hypothetical protein